MTLTSLGFGFPIKLDANSSVVEVVFMGRDTGLGVELPFQPLILAFQSSTEHSDMAATPY